jgi:WD40 repeat protein
MQLSFSRPTSLFGCRIVTGSDDSTLRVWDGSTGECCFLLTGHTCGIECLASTPTAHRVVSGSWDGTIRVWNAITGQSLAWKKGDCSRNRRRM